MFIWFAFISRIYLAIAAYTHSLQPSRSSSRRFPFPYNRFLCLLNSSDPSRAFAASLCFCFLLCARVFFRCSCIRINFAYSLYDMRSTYVRIIIWLTVTDIAMVCGCGQQQSNKNGLWFSGSAFLSVTHIYIFIYVNSQQCPDYVPRAKALGNYVWRVQLAHGRIPSWSMFQL